MPDYISSENVNHSKSKRGNSEMESYLKDDNVLIIVALNASRFRSSTLVNLILDQFESGELEKKEITLWGRLFWCLTKCDIFINNEVLEEIKSVMEGNSTRTAFSVNGWCASVADTQSVSNIGKSSRKMEQSGEYENEFLYPFFFSIKTRFEVRLVLKT